MGIKMKEETRTDYEIMAVSNRKLCTKEFQDCIDNAIKDGAKYLILREKDLSYDEYVKLAKNVNQCIQGITYDTKENVERVHLILNVGGFADTEKIKTLMCDTGCNNIHLPFNNIKDKEELKNVRNLTNGLFGMSVHDRMEAVMAEKYGADYIMAGHIFETICKPGLKPRGIDFLTEVCKSVHIPVYAIGGMNKENALLAVRAGARGICIMSGYFN